MRCYGPLYSPVGRNSTALRCRPTLPFINICWKTLCVMDRINDSELLIREFLPGDETAFRDLNEAWIRQYFVLESKDHEVLSDPVSKILAPGGRIIVAVLKGRTIGCCALLSIGPREYEIAKMAVAEDCRGAGIGKQLLKSAIDAARTHGATRLYVETSHKLPPAIRLYESAGFRHLAPERVVPSAYSRTDIYMELYL